ncbi:hypothetical protein RAJCM14343_2464 [Rhodococcus aetherivorans]|uniref:Uncharacterized protein n=1 Tax=Rhodococcus aetherivorans TaxID=191292 RepID=A0ABQ0YKV8_9NOCA|nr:hypothetical protein RAJCM14343_2464 [Rhodococcus aetherivorans]CCW11163.1 hypothetical protein EBESD8_16990 [Rhodococcus aetherivorans]
MVHPCTVAPSAALSTSGEAQRGGAATAGRPPPPVLGGRIPLPPRVRGCRSCSSGAQRSPGSPSTRRWN